MKDYIESIIEWNNRAKKLCREADLCSEENGTEIELTGNRELNVSEREDILSDNHNSEWSRDIYAAADSLKKEFRGNIEGMISALGEMLAESENLMEDLESIEKAS